MSSEPISLYGIIGHPVKHSLSPAMHNAAFAQLGVSAEYRLFELQENELQPFFDDLKSETSPIFGFNVTVPYKERVLSMIDNVSPLAEKIGAVNTVVINKQRKLIGYNTDAPGFLAHMVELGFQTRGKRIAMLGAGGSSRAIIATLCMIPDRPESIRLYNRTLSRAESLIADIGSRIDTSIVHIVDQPEDLNIELSDCLINSTSVGLNEEDPLIIDPEAIHSNLLVYDLIYNPRRTALLQEAEERGAKVANGLGMLFYQGVLAFEHWASTRIDDQTKMVMREALEKGI